MGNSSSGDTFTEGASAGAGRGLGESHPDLTSGENASLEATLRRLSPGDSSSSHMISKEAFVEHLGVQSHADFASLLYDSIATGPEMSWTRFREVFVDIIRSNSITPLRRIQSILLSDSTIDSDHGTRTFFRLLLEFVDPDYSSKDELSDRLADYCPSSLDSPDFVPFVASHLPLASQAITSFFHAKFCPEVRCPKPFHLPSLEAASSIVSHPGDLFPLSLLSGSLQGRWVQLYSSDSHGFSFNRVAHHILGYHVRSYRLDSSFTYILGTYLSPHSLWGISDG